MVKLRLKRAGKKRAAFYRIVAADSRIKRDGEYIELVGTYNPINGEVNVKNEIALKWLQQGAQPTETVRNIFSKQGIMTELHNVKLENKKNEPKTEKKIKKVASKLTVAKKQVSGKSAVAKKPSATKKTEITSVE
ncbi:30S ribosomal protein S16 [Spiroplasma taiwanense CT-1]|uniref:Small ribosomal subunit protein bS16 n=1 Tax=Spiroplasma taiwanense CT-1 TaxID=1276220 RepID=S5LTE6_9MOLU|nr:30S ribosomal protein S16 [Spiroplasma taiwanense]AGR40979.1 30S ribosomal protein S16 [Spiroplasma taiwanense CT-1]